MLADILRYIAAAALGFLGIGLIFFTAIGSDFKKYELVLAISTIALAIILINYSYKLLA